jgi:hypothetical protein
MQAVILACRSNDVHSVLCVALQCFANQLSIKAVSTAQRKAHAPDAINDTAQEKAAAITVAWLQWHEQKHKGRGMVQHSATLVSNAHTRGSQPDAPDAVGC